MKSRFNKSYRELVALEDGTNVELRLVRPEDKALFVAGFAQLSTEARYLRFFTGKDHLSKSELEYFTEMDGERHFAIGAVGPEGGVGVARFIRLDDEPDVAEFAVTIIDDMQRKGLGRVLYERLIAAARERGIKHLRGLILRQNRGMLALVENQGATRELDGDALIVDLPVHEVAPQPLVD